MTRIHYTGFSRRLLMENQTKAVSFNPKTPTVLHIDLNSCFATIEQQANPKLRGKPIAVAAYDSPRGCILAPSKEAKLLGIKVGMRVSEGKILCRNLIILTPDPWKYRTIHMRLKELLLHYSNVVIPKSIDEFIVDIEGYPAEHMGAVEVAKEIKERIRKEIGEWLTVSIGIAPNRYLAKIGAGLHKPDGLDVIDAESFSAIYKSLELTDLCGIKVGNASRLQNGGIHSVWDMYSAPIWQMKAAFHSIVGYYWWMRLHGWEIDDVESSRKTYGNSYALPDTRVTPQALAPILMKLVEKTGARLRKAGYVARGVHLAIVYRDHSFWHKGKSIEEDIFDSRDIYKHAYALLEQSPERKPVANIAISCFHLSTAKGVQQGLFEDREKKGRVVEAIDAINERWGAFVITPAMMMGMGDKIIDRISFGGIKELEESILHS